MSDLRTALVTCVICAVLSAGAAAADSCADSADPTRDTSVEGLQYMVSAANPDAVKAGCDVLKDGGDAIDAAVAVQAALSVVEPQASGIAGGAIIMYWDNHAKQVRYFEGLSIGAAIATSGLRTPFDDEITECGTDSFNSNVEVTGRAFGVPGALKVLDQVHQIYGRKRWSTLFDAGIELAEDGFAMPAYMNKAMGESTRGLNRCDYPDLRARYCTDGEPIPVGTTIYNPEIAEVMREVATGGAEAFYNPNGTIVQAILERVSSSTCRPRHNDDGAAIVSSRLTGADFANYESVERTPLCKGAFGRTICAAAPPSFGGVAVHEMIGLLTRGGIEEMTFGDLDYTHLMLEASRLAQFDRRENIGDPDFNASVNLAAARLVSEDFLDQRFNDYSPNEANNMVLPTFKATPAEDFTSHVSIVDRFGNAISMTTTNNTTFGAQMEAKGMILNNAASNFTRPGSISPGQLVNQMEPSKRPRTSITPSIVLDGDGQLELVVGAAGGGPIPDYTLKVMMGVLLDGLNAQEAINRPNLSGQGITSTCNEERIPQPRAEVEANTVLTDLLEGLESDLKHQCARANGLRSGLAAINIRAERLFGGADPRRDGVAMGH